MTTAQSIDESRRRHPSVVRDATALFAHPSERIFAKLLTLYGFEWIYEPIEFPLQWSDAGVPVRGFRPDFYLPSRQLFIEMTVLEQRLVTKKNRKIRQFRTLYPEVQLLVVYQRDFLRLAAHHDLGPMSDHAA